MSDAFGGELIERDRVAEAPTAGMRRGGQKTVVRRVAAVDVGMPDAAEDREVLAVRAQQFQIRRKLIATPLLVGRREKLSWQHSEVVADGEEARRRGVVLSGAREGGQHRIEPGEPQRDAGPA